MVRKIHGACMTQSEASDLIPNIQRVLPYVDSMTIIDGGSKDLTIPYFKNWARQEKKLNYLISPWEGDFPKQRNKYVAEVAKLAQEGDWLLTFDPDEFFEVEALEKLHKAADRAEQDRCNMVGFRCRSVSLEGPVRVWENLDEYWKELFIRWDPNFHYTGYKCHEGKGGVPHGIMRTNLIYEHVKQNNIIWIRGARNMFTAGGGPNLGDRNPAWARIKEIAANLNLHNWHEVYDYMVRGNIDSSLKQFMIDHMFEGMENAGPNSLSGLEPDRFPRGWDGASEMREWYKSYFRFLHNEEEAEEFKGVHIE